MKRLVIVFLIISLPMMAFAQLKSQTKLPDFRQSLAAPATSLLFGFFDPSRMQMHHSFSMSYITVGGKGMMLNSYMNTIDYRISNPLFLRLNIGLMNSPYNSFVSNPGLNNTQFFGGAELQYRPTNNMMLRFGVNVAPAYYYPYRLWYDEPR